MTETPFRRARALRRAGLVVACGALVSLVVVLVREGDDADTASMWVSVVSAVLSASALVVDLVRDPEPAGGAAGEPADRRRQVADALADAVGVQWSAEARGRRLHDPEPLDVTWSRVGPPLADRDPGLPVPAPRAGDGRLSRVVEAFRDASDRLVVLGEPGAGKSVLAVKFVLDALEARRTGGPVPVLFAAAGWDPSATSLREWLADRLAKDYDSLAAPVGDGRTLARDLLDAGLILPVLDGFDEIPPAAHGEALRLLNDELDASLPALITCRTTAWQNAVRRGGPLRSATVVRLRPLDFAAARDHLSRTARYSGTWAPVLENAPEPLVEALRSPLTVTLARAVYEDPTRDPTELADPVRFRTARDIEDHVLDAFVPTAYAGPGTPWHPQAAHRWLSRLARDLADSTAGLAWWETPAALPRVLRVAGPAVLALLATATLLVPVAVHGEGVIANWDSTPSALFNFAGILTGLCFGLAVLPPPTPRTPQGPRWLVRTALWTTGAAAVTAVGMGLLVPPLVSSRLGAVVTPRPAWFLNGCCLGLILSMVLAVAGVSRRPGPLSVPWAGSPSGPRAMRALGALIVFAGLAVHGYTGARVPAATGVVTGLVLLLAGLGRTGRPTTARYVAPSAALRAFARGLLRGLVACTLIGVFAGAVVGTISGAFAAAQIRSAPDRKPGTVVEGWLLTEVDGERAVRSRTAQDVLLVERAGLDAPFAVPRDALIFYDKRKDRHRGDVTLRHSPEDGWVMDWPGPRAARRGGPVDAHNLVLDLPRPVELWLVRRSTAAVLLDAVGPLVAFGVLVGMIGGCASGVHRALNTPSDVIRAAGPLSSLRTDRTATLARSAVAALVSGAACLLLIAVVGRDNTLGTMHTELWVPVGTYSLALSAWGRTATARVWLALTGRAPWRLMAFLEDAHRRGVLRRAGARYEFRHQRLRHRLAAAAPAGYRSGGPVDPAPGGNLAGRAADPAQGGNGDGGGPSRSTART